MTFFCIHRTTENNKPVTSETVFKIEHSVNRTTYVHLELR